MYLEVRVGVLMTGSYTAVCRDLKDSKRLLSVGWSGLSKTKRARAKLLSEEFKARVESIVRGA